MPQSNPEDFNVNLTVSGDDRVRVRKIGAIVAAVIIAFIILTMTTGIASFLLPMRDQYLLAMIPAAPDGEEPLSLKRLEHETTSDHTVTVRGVVGNRTDYSISGILVVVDIIETTGRFPQTLEVPVDPQEIEAQGEAAFDITTTMEQRPISYTVKFRFADGPFVPHKDERQATFGITGG